MAGTRMVPFEEEHLEAFAAILDDDGVRRFTRIPVPMPEDFPRSFFERYRAGRAEGTRELFAGLDDDGAFVGVAMALSIDRAAQEAELGYLVAREARGRGHAARLLGEITRWAFAEAEVVRAFLIIDVLNAPSLAVARRCGYFHEGTLRSTWLKPGFPRADVTVWSRLSTD